MKLNFEQDPHSHNLFHLNWFQYKGVPVHLVISPSGLSTDKGKLSYLFYLQTHTPGRGLAPFLQEYSSGMYIPYPQSYRYVSFQDMKEIVEGYPEDESVFLFLQNHAKKTIDRIVERTCNP